MNSTAERFAYRCLPMVMANQAGWMIANPIDFSVSWNGGGRREDVLINFGDVKPTDQFAFQVSVGANQNQSDERITSHFGSGVVTFTIPYLFRTPPEINLWVKGPSNWIKDGAYPLEGIVETDWSAATFTMNWKLTRPGLIVEFKRGEPICMIVPVQRGLAEGLTPHQALINTNSELESEYKTWNTRREEFNEALAQNRSTSKSGWEKDYFQGRAPSGDYFEDHQTQIGLKEFVVKQA
jgi:antitoxin (DNA-binding transcriptional repressor) of toxin-antitoxin stability system